MPIQHWFSVGCPLGYCNMYLTNVIQTAGDVRDLTLKAPIMTAADDIHKYYFIVCKRKEGLMFQVNPLLGRGFT